MKESNEFIEQPNELIEESVTISADPKESIDQTEIITEPLEEPQEQLETESKDNQRSSGNSQPWNSSV